MKFDELRTALAAGPVAGPWNTAEYTDHDGPPEVAVQATDPRRPLHLETLALMNWAERVPMVAAFTRSEATATAAFIWAADPQTVSALLAERDTMRALLAEWHDGMYDSRDFLRRVRLVLHGDAGLQVVPVGPNVEVDAPLTARKGDK